ncbi:hypothetical protein AB0I81_18870 [Nonomuraea sp. NPDC050404]|uniref:hypothetical protein n=1 Tax=Nonomuraea sp. NPDC050404 TaxID=3155783 RepID=UPI0034110CAE
MLQRVRDVAGQDEAAPEGEQGRVLRREGLYSSSIDLWRRQRDNGELTPAGPTAASRARRTPEQLELERLRKEKTALARDKAKAEKKLAQTEAALDIMGRAPDVPSRSVLRRRQRP